ncbi:MAG: hypothetical protein WBM75_03865 [Polyangiales bacterium]
MSGESAPERQQRRASILTVRLQEVSSTMSKRALRNFFLALSLIPLGWALIHTVRGGIELPAPKWSEADLVPLPYAADNAWYAMWPLEKMPAFALDIEARDDGSPILEKDRATIEAELNRGEVQELLATLPDVLERAALAHPVEVEPGNNKALRPHRWWAWVELSLASQLETRPGLVAERLTKLFPLWVSCANPARTTVHYFICADAAKRALLLMARAASVLSRSGDTRGLEQMRAMLLDTPVVSPSNQERAEYIELYGVVDSLVSDNIPFMIDLRDTVETLNRYFDPVLVEGLCASWFDRPRTPLYAYNFIGRQLATDLSTSVCTSRGAVQKVTRALKEARAALAEQLESQL